MASIDDEKYSIAFVNSIKTFLNFILINNFNNKYHGRKDTEL